MDKIQLNNNPTRKKTMEFKQTDEVVVVDEKITTVFEAKQVEVKPTIDNKRWIESLSDCA